MSKRKSVATINVRGSDYNAIERSLKKFSKATSGIISEYKRTLDHYSKPSEIRHRKKKEYERASLIERGLIRQKKRRTKRGDKSNSRDNRTS